MSKLLEWIGAFVAGFSIWYTLLTNAKSGSILFEWKDFIVILPVLLVGMFGVYSVVTVLWRVATFRNCPEAAQELQEQIILAKVDLKKRGLER